MFSALNRRKRARASALLIVIILTAVFGALSVAYVTAASASLTRAQLHRDHRRSLAMAETGLKLGRESLPLADVRNAETAEEVLAAVASTLNAKYRTTLFRGETAVVQGDRVVLPPLLLSFSEGEAQVEVTFIRESDTSFLLESRGRFGDSSKRVAMRYVSQPDRRILSTYGVASRSRITMKGNGRIIGQNNMLEGSILSATFVNLDAIDLTGHVYVSGNVAVANPQGSVSIKGNTTVGGEVMIGVEVPAFPELDIAPFAAYATHVIDSKNVKIDDGVLDNIYIKAGTNPTFNGNTVIRGVVYIEAPNDVNFTGSLTLTGVIVGEDTSANPNLRRNVVRFGGNVTSYGVELLPDEPKFAGLRDMTGSFALLPGFSMIFTGNFSTLQGSLAASKFEFSGNCTGTIKGSVLNYNDSDFEVSGNTQLTIDHDGASQDPAGMTFPRRLMTVEGSYEE
jgi:cytoskeletal protein CcmA (bactofilin family)